MFAVGLDLELLQRQELSLSPQLLQAMEILQMNTYDLRGFIQKEAQENPVLEAEHVKTPDEDAALFSRKLLWLAGQPQRRRGGPVTEGDDPVMQMAERLRAPLWEETLEAHLLWQLPSLRLRKEAEHCARFLIRCVDDRGYLDEEPTCVAEQLGLTPETVTHVLALLRTLDPPGICAQNLSGCLAAQLPGDGPQALARAVAQNHLQELARGHYAAIARAVGVTAEQVAEAGELIRRLDPCPGAVFSQGAAPVYVVPDVLVTMTPDGFDLSFNDRLLPVLSVSSYYLSLLKNNDSEEVRQYLAERIQRARWLIGSVEQRRDTLLACARAIVELEAAYFRGHTRHPVPLLLAEVAERVGLHPSTVSRAIRDKYLQCDGSVTPLRGYFSRGLSSASGERQPSEAARAGIRQFIDAEDKKRPLSDQKLCELLAAQGLSLSRRTVAKYRDELGIPGTSVRRAR